MCENNFKYSKCIHELTIDCFRLANQNKTNECVNFYCPKMRYFNWLTNLRSGLAWIKDIYFLD